MDEGVWFVFMVVAYFSAFGVFAVVWLLLLDAGTTLYRHYVDWRRSQRVRRAMSSYRLPKGSNHYYRGAR